jgi:hypothetical protein
LKSAFLQNINHRTAFSGFENAVQPRDFPRQFFEKNLNIRIRGKALFFKGKRNFFLKGWIDLSVFLT